MAQAFEVERSTASEVRGASLIGVIADFDQLLHRLCKVVSHLDVLGDRIEGSRPAKVSGKDHPDAPPHSTITDLQRKRDGLLTLCDQFEGVAQRLDRAIGSNSNDAGGAMRADIR